MAYTIAGVVLMGLSGAAGAIAIAGKAAGVGHAVSGFLAGALFYLALAALARRVVMLVREK